MANTLRFDVVGRGDASDLEKLAAAFNNLTERMMQLDRTRAEPTVDVDTRTAERNVGKFADDMQRTIKRAVESLPDIEINADSSDTDREIARIREDLKGISDQRIGIDIDAATAQAEVARLEGDLRALGDINLNVQMKADVASAMAQLAAVNGEIDRLDGRKVDVKFDVDRSLGDSIVQIAALGRALGTLVLPAAAVAAAPQLAAIGAAAITAAGAVGILPAAAGAAMFAITGLKVAFSGFGEALKNLDDPKKFAEALKELAPAAAAAAVAIKSLQKPWKELQQSTQQELFKGWAEQILALGQIYIPLLEPSLHRVAQAANEAGLAFADMFREKDTWRDVQVLLSNFSTSFSDVARAAAPVAAALLDIALVGSEVFGDLTKGAVDAARAFRDFIRDARESGQLEQWMRAGVDAVAQLGRIAGNTGATLYNVFKTAEDAGAGLLSRLEAITAATRDWTASAEGQATIAAVFRSIGDAVDAAAPGIRALVDAISSVIQRLGEAGVLKAAGEAFSALASEVAPLITQLGNLAPAVTTILNAVRDLAPVLIPAAAALAGFWAAAKLMTGINAIATNVGALAGRFRDLGTSMSGGGITGALKGLASAIGPGGILGIALAGAGLALSLYASSQADAAQAAADHKAKVDELAGSLNKYSGAATDATRAQVAQELGTRKLSDGTTSYASALGAAGVSTKNFVEATTGNEVALTKVRGQLDAHVRSLISATPVYKNGESQLRAMGVSLDDVTAAAQGNGPALERINAAVGSLGGPASETGSAFQMLVNELMRAGGGSAELGRELNTMAGQFGEAQQQTRDAAAANRDFSTTLDAIKVGFGGLANGAAQTDLMRAGLVDLSTAARDAAQASGDAAAKFGGVAAGSKAAADSMQQSRDAFVGAAMSAGLTAEQAGALADQIGLIPAAASTTFTSNATGVAAEFITLGQQVAAVPGAKTITVQSLSDEAKAKLTDLGFTVTNLPNGQVQVDVHDEAGRQRLLDFIAFGNGQITVVKVDADPNPATGKITATVRLGNGQTAVMTYDAKPDPATGKINATVDLGNGKTAVMTLDADPRLAQGDISGTVSYANGQTGTIKIATAGVPQANSAIDNAARNRTTTITVQYAGTRPGSAMGIPIPQAAGGIVAAMHGGGVVRFGNGGQAVKRLTPMSEGRAQVVPPNTWRVVGDRARNDEAYIPINGSARSRQILGTTAMRMGYAVVPRAAIGMAAGGSVTYGSVSQSKWDSLRSQGWKGRAGDNVERLYAPSSSGSGGGSLGSLSVSVRRMAVGGVLQPGQPGGGATSGAYEQILAPQRGAWQSAGQATAASSVAGVENRLDQLVQLIERRGAGASITVNDSSGDPAETARSTMLALRLS